MYFDNDDNIINEASIILNIHKERLTIKKKKNSIDIINEKIESGQYIFSNDKHNNKIVYISNKTYSESLEKIKESNNEIIIIEDIIHSNITDSKKLIDENSSNFIKTINDKYIISDKLSNDIIDFLEKTIREDPEKIETEKWENSRNVNAIYIGSDYLEKNNQELYRKINSVYSKIVSELHCTRYSTTYNYFHNNKFTIRKIYGPTRKHCDGIYGNAKEKGQGFERHSSCIVCLNDDYTGGEFIFEKQNFKYKMTKNDIIVFPPYYTHPHRTLQLENRTYRYTINTWFLVKH